MLKKIVIASHNAGKVREFGALFAPLSIEAISAGDLHISEPEETGSTFAANAELKARHCFEASGLPALSDDSGLVIPALGGAPGIYSARWAGADKNFATAFARIEKELGEAKAPLISPAYFICALCLVFPDGKTEHFEGRIDGALTFPPRGNHGFGYDPIFIPQGYDVTFGEMDANYKHTISHRALAFAKFLQYMQGRTTQKANHA